MGNNVVSIKDANSLRKPSVEVQSVSGTASNIRSSNQEHYLIPNTYNNTALSNGGEAKMDEATKMLLEKLNDDMREHKQEIRDRDARLQSEMQEREKRIIEDSKAREERILAAIKESGDRNNQQITEIKNEVAENTKHVQTLVTTNIWGMIAAIIAIVGLAITVLFAIN